MFLIHGAGKTGKDFLKECEKKAIEDIRVCDKNKLLHGASIHGYMIEDSQQIDVSQFEAVVVTTTWEVYKEIKNELREKWGNEIEVLYILDVVVIGDENLNLGNLKFENEIRKGIYRNKDVVKLFDNSSFNAIDSFIYNSEHKVVHKWVHYSEVYDKYFSKYKGKEVSILEIGVFGGGSLQLWKNYFKEGLVKVYGIDINPECKKLEEKDIKIFIGSQDDRKFLREIKSHIGKVDIVIDDGGHEMNQQIVSFEELFDIVKEDGIYLCEDTQTSYEEKWGGGYKNPSTFIEYSKNIIDGLYTWYINEQNNANVYGTEVKSISYFENMVVIEKKKKTSKGLSLCIDNVEK